MARMADRILQGNLYYPRWVTGGKLVKVVPSNVHAYVGNKLQQAQIIDASNVASFYYSGSRRSDWSSPLDFPNVAPPFPLFWIEMRCPKVLTSSEASDKTPVRLPFGFGCLVEAYQGRAARKTMQEAAPWFSSPEGKEDLIESFATTLKLSIEAKERRYGTLSLWEHLTVEEKPYYMLTRMYKDSEQRKQVLANFPDDGWTCVIDVLVEEQKGVVFGPLGCCVLVMGGAGEAMHLSRAGLHFKQAPDCLMSSFEDVHFIEAVMNPVMLTISFMHCRNVVMRRNEPAAGRKKRSLASYGVEPVRYHTLEIQAMRDVLRREGGMMTVGLPRALHICRGHFKTYQDQGLFGKHRGTFWVPMHLRGTAEEGIVKKEYRVLGP
jgi:hypothetical protein